MSDRKMTDAQRAYEAKRAAKAGMSLEKWMAQKEKRAAAEAKEAAAAPRPPPPHRRSRASSPACWKRRRSRSDVRRPRDGTRGRRSRHASRTGGALATMTAGHSAGTLRAAPAAARSGAGRGPCDARAAAPRPERGWRAACPRVCRRCRPAHRRSPSPAPPPDARAARDPRYSRAHAGRDHRDGRDPRAGRHAGAGGRFRPGTTSMLFAPGSAEITQDARDALLAFLRPPRPAASRATAWSRTPTAARAPARWPARGPRPSPP